MLKKLITLICHPSFIGLYFLDKVSTILLWISCFFVFTTGLLATKDLIKPRFTHQTSIVISDIFLQNENLKTTTYSNHLLNGSKVTIECEDVTIIVNESAYVNNNLDFKLILVFSQSEANAYYAGMNLGKVKYDDIDIKDFSIQEIRDSKNVILRSDLESFITSFLNNVEMNYRSVIFFLDFRDILVFYLLTLLVCFIASVIRNPRIEGKIRRRLIAYDSIIYFVFIWFELFFEVYWLSYVGVCFAVLYTILTFSRIKMISYKREG